MALGAAAPAVANPLSPIWTGAYVGLHGGAAWADVDIDSATSINVARPSIGGHAGYNLGLGGWIIGIEADASHAGSKSAFSPAGGAAASIETDWRGSVRGRLGVVVGPALLFATAGWTWAGVTLAEGASVGTMQNVHARYNGVVYGLGAEAYVLPAISLRLEALRYDYGAEKLSVGSGLAALREIGLGDTVVRGGVSLHFR